jgi:hypothetical protein
MKNLKIQNPTQQVQKILAKWKIDSGFERTCLSDTCCCMSHDSGFSWVEYSVPDSVALYLEMNGRLLKTGGSVHSHHSTVWNGGPFERQLRDRDEYQAKNVKVVIHYLVRAIQAAKALGFSREERILLGIKTLCYLACCEVVQGENTGYYRSLIDRTHNLEAMLYDKKRKDREKEKNSFLSPGQWSALDKLELAK